MPHKGQDQTDRQHIDEYRKVPGGRGVPAKGSNHRKDRADRDIKQNVEKQMRNEPEMAELGVPTPQVVAKDECDVSLPRTIDRIADGPEDEDDNQEQRDPEPDQTVPDHARSTVPRKACVEEIARDQEKEPHEEGPVEHEERQKQIAGRRIIHDVAPVATSDGDVGLRCVMRDNEESEQDADPLDEVEPGRGGDMVFGNWMQGGHHYSLTGTTLDRDRGARVVENQEPDRLKASGLFLSWSFRRPDVAQLF